MSLTSVPTKLTSKLDHYVASEVNKCLTNSISEFLQVPKMSEQHSDI